MASDYLEKKSECPLCGSSRIHPAFQVHYWRENLFDYWDCEGCRAAFANPMPSDALISRGNDALVRLYQGGRSLEQEFREARQAYLRGKTLARKLKRWKRTGKVLELGCYHGFFSLGIRENSDWEVEGLEISTELNSFVRENLGIPCYLGTLEEAEVPAGRFDFVVCHDLIEHVNQPLRFIEKLARILAPGGRVQIITPNGRQDLAFTRRAYRAGTPMTMLLNHILYFQPSTLRSALERQGLRTLKLYGYDVRYALKDFGLFGMGKPSGIGICPSMGEALRLEPKKTLSIWSPEKLAELRTHRKTSAFYGFIKESLPRAFRLRIPPSLAIGHEIYALAERPR